MKYENWKKQVNSLYNKSNNINNVLIDLHYLCNIDNIKNILESNSENKNYTLEYYNKPDGQLISIGEDQTNNLSLAIEKKSVLHHNLLHFFDTYENSIDVCIFSDTNIFLLLNKTCLTSYNETSKNNIPCDVQLINRPTEKVIHNIYNNKKFIYSLEYLNDSSYSLCNKFLKIFDGDINYELPNSNIKLEKVGNKDFLVLYLYSK